MSTSVITLGTDPELFAMGANSAILAEKHLPIVDGAIPAWYVMGLTDPDMHTIVLPEGELTPDGAALEFTTRPTADPRIMVDYIRRNLLATKELTDAFGSTLSVTPRAYVHQAFIDMLPKEYGKASSLQVLGCDPDVCVYDNITIPAKPDPRTYNYRTSGGHIHVGIGDLTKNRMVVSYIIAALDATIGCASKVLCSSEEAKLRQLMYGMPGMYRSDHKRGTIEYRTLPAQALIQTPELCERMFTIASNVTGLIVDTFQESGIRGVADLMTTEIGDLDIIFKRAEMIKDHNIEACRAMCWTSMVGDLLEYEMPQDFLLHGWE